MFSMRIPNKRVAKCSTVLVKLHRQTQYGEFQLGILIREECSIIFRALSFYLLILQIQTLKTFKFVRPRFTNNANYRKLSCKHAPNSRTRARAHARIKHTHKFCLR